VPCNQLWDYNKHNVYPMYFIFCPQPWYWDRHVQKYNILICHIILSCICWLTIQSLLMWMTKVYFLGTFPTIGKQIGMIQNCNFIFLSNLSFDFRYLSYIENNKILFHYNVNLRMHSLKFYLFIDLQPYISQDQRCEE
jgi:hypothetical protein